MPNIKTTRISTLLFLRCCKEPKNEDRLETNIFVPAAILGFIPINNIIGSLIVPSANPTNPPRRPTKNDIIPKNIRISINPKGGFVFREGGRDVTPSLIKNGGGIFSPNQSDPNSFSNVEYIIQDWGIEPLNRTNPKLFHQIHPMKAGAFTNSTYYIWVSIGIKNIEDPTVSNDPSHALYQIKMFDRISFSPSLFIQKFTSSSNQSESGI